MKIISTGATLASPGFLEKKQKRRRKRRMIFMGGLVSLLIALVLVSRIESLRINEIKVIGAAATSPDSVAAVAGDQLAGYYAYLVPKDNSMIYSRSGVKEMLYRKFPRFSLVALSIENQSLEISVTEREPFALYCGSADSCYFLDKEGFIFDRAPTFSEGVYFTYSMQEPLPEPLGQRFLPSDDFTRLSAFVGKLPELHLEPLSLVMKENEFELLLNSGASLTWEREAVPERIFSNLESFLLSPEISGDPGFLSRVLKLDLRTENKVFYSFK